MLLDFGLLLRHRACQILQSRSTTTTTPSLDRILTQLSRAFPITGMPGMATPTTTGTTSWLPLGFQLWACSCGSSLLRCCAASLASPDLVSVVLSARCLWPCAARARSTS